MNKYIFIILLFQSLNQLCSEGCLKCSPNNECQFCDFLSLYYLKENSCEKITEKNCTIGNTKGECMICKSGYYYDQNTKKCVQITLTQKIENCIHYNAFFGCDECKRGFYQQDGKCVIPEIPIVNCLFYETKQKCKYCQQGYINSFDNHSCVIDNNLSCAQSSYYKCRECKNGFIKNENKWFYDVVQNDQELSKIENYKILLENFSQINRVKYFQQCILLTNEMQNCEEFLDFNQCKKCKLGYFLNSQKICQKNLTPKIQNCIQYKSETECQKCQQGFYIKTKDLCESVTEIPNCKSYKQGHVYRTVCEECEISYYLKNENCIKRVNEVVDCIKYKIFSDECEQCKSPLIYNDQKIKCQQRNNNCKKQNFFSDNIECLECDDKYYLENHQCYQGNIPNCKNYQDKNFCKICEPTFIQKQGTCYTHNLIDNCDYYNPQDSNQCFDCNYNSVQVTHTKICKSVSIIINKCIKYSDQNTCEKCDLGYYLDGDKKCQLIPYSLDCLEYDVTDGCKKCKMNYVMEKNKCFTPSIVHTSNCAQFEIDGTQQFQESVCQICNKGNFPYNLKNNYYCIEQNKIDYFNTESIQNCQYYQYTDKLSCKTCIQGFFLSDTGQCILEINCSDQLITFKIGTNNYIESNNICSTILNDNNQKHMGCVEGTVNITDFQKNVCIFCNQNNYITMIDDFESSNSVYIPMKIFEPFNKHMSPSPISFYPQIKCYAKENTNFYLNNLVNNCEYYAEFESKVGCIKCENGYQGLIKEKYFIYQCQQMLSCKTKEIYGANKNINQLVSCFQCQSNNQIPFIFIHAEQLYKGIKYLIPYNSDYQYEDQNSSETIKCLEPSYTVLKLQSLNFPSNCAIGVYNLNSLKIANNSNVENDVDISKIAVFCAECQPGYKKISGKQLGEKIQDFVSKCEQITNCKYTNWLNYCEQCKENYVWEYSEEQIKFDSCVQHLNNQYCLSAEKQLNSTTCKICKKGYILNKDGICQLVQLLQCQDFTQGLQLTSLNYNIIHYWFHRPQGCHQCLSNFQLFKHTTENDFYTCLPSYYDLSIEFSKYIKNCAKYKVSEQVICIQCIDGYTINIQHSSCINIQLSDCLEIDPQTNRCGKCKPGKYLHNGECIEVYIQNCDEINDFGYIKCIKCKTGFYRKNNLCEQGGILNCQYYKQDGSENKCEKCLPGYLLSIDNISRQNCLKIDPYLKCSEMTIDLNNEVTCTQCQEHNYLKTINSSDDERKNSCFLYSKDPKCKIVVKNEEQISNSKLQCTECEDGYYLQGEQCKLNKEISHCKVFSKNQNGCQECEEKYFVNNNLECELNPFGFTKCQVYENEEKCKYCQTGYIFRDNICQPIPVQIENCQYYVDEKECGQCNEGFIWEYLKCERIEIEYCLEFIDKKHCEKCMNGYVLQFLDDKLTCKKIEKPKNCRNILNVSPFSCIECENGYYLNVDKCIEITNKISGCKFYAGDGLCEQWLKNLFFQKQLLIR